MSLLHQLWIASAVAAASFFAAGAMTAALRQRKRAEASAADPAELGALRQQLAGAEAQLGQLRLSEQRAREEAAAAMRAAQQQQQANAKTVMGRPPAEANPEVANLERKLAAAEAALAAEQARARRAEAAQRAAVAEPPPSQLVRDAQELASRLAAVESSLSERSSQLRDAQAQLEVLRGRANEADAMRAEYVRLRTQVNDVEFLTKEVDRLSAALKSAQSVALGGQAKAPRAPQQRAGAPGSITEALGGAIAKFSNPQTHGVAIADAVGFPISSQGEDGIELAAYAALLHDVAQRAKQFLPMATPEAIEVRDDHGARVTVWPFDVASDRLLLVTLAVNTPESDKVEAMLAEVSAILAPAKVETQTQA